MKTIDYAGVVIVTGDRIADEVMRYAVALASRGLADKIAIPVIDASGSVSRFDLLVGPASQLVMEPTVSEFADPADESVERELEEKIARLQPSRPVADGVLMDESAIDELEIPDD